MLLRKNESSFKKKFHRRIIFQASGNPIRKRTAHGMKVVIQNLTIIGRHASSQCVKSVRIRSFSSTYFAEFELNTKRYGTSLYIQFKCWKIRTEKHRIRTLFRQCPLIKFWSNIYDLKVI